MGVFDTLPTFLSVPSQIAAGVLFTLSPQLPFVVKLVFGLGALALFVILVRREH